MDLEVLALLCLYLWMEGLETLAYWYPQYEWKGLFMAVGVGHGLGTDTIMPGLSYSFLVDKA